MLRYLPSTCRGTDVLGGGGEKAAELVPTSRTGGDGKQPGTRSDRDPADGRGSVPGAAGGLPSLPAASGATMSLLLP